MYASILLGEAQHGFRQSDSSWLIHLHPALPSLLWEHESRENTIPPQSLLPAPTSLVQFILQAELRMVLWLYTDRLSPLRHDFGQGWGAQCRGPWADYGENARALGPAGVQHLGQRLAWLCPRAGHCRGDGASQSAAYPSAEHALHYVRIDQCSSEAMRFTFWE